MAAAAPKLKVTYFDGPGRAEVTRLLLHYGKVEFEDERLDKEGFGKLRETGVLPFQQLPVLHIDDTILAQSEAMESWAAHFVGLIPQDPLKAAQVQMTICALRDVSDAMVKIVFMTKDEEEKKTLKAKFLEETLPKIFGGIEKYATDGFLHGDQITYADIATFSLVERFLRPNFDNLSLEAYPKLAASVEKVGKLPALADYLKRYE